ncbi:LutC/YkgG family protein [Blastochloris tepida]|uniref:LUD domain-containing protein n=1 Tax=Blastochloris tepida TaxID=2233851 RepID=A0A348G2B4_9HYPH|nr:LUD domain-containing protein [Blastochloris tepida]BBF93697.1 hypothetical protein BLTE_23820 [Blastochloris tepida]
MSDSESAPTLKPVNRPPRATSRDRVLGTLRHALDAAAFEELRRDVVASRLASHPRGPIPARGQIDRAGRLALFRDQAIAAGATVEPLASLNAVPAAVCAVLRAHNLPLQVRMGADSRLAALPWHAEPALEIGLGPSDGGDLAAVSFAFGAVAESGTLVLLSGPNNPTTLNFLPDTHIVVLAADDVVGDYETVWDALRAHFGPAVMPRAINWITGPSRSADIEQRLVFGAHGPRRLHILVAG